MPVKKMPPRRASPMAEDLRLKLVQEWKNPKEKGEPLILQDSSGPPSSRSTRIYVVWTEWGDLSMQERSEIIMDAYEKTHSTDDTLTVTSALGLTPQEADRMRILSASCGVTLTVTSALGLTPQEADRMRIPNE